jgi:hypothetical protein
MLSLLTLRDGEIAATLPVFSIEEATRIVRAEYDPSAHYQILTNGTITHQWEETMDTFCFA